MTTNIQTEKKRETRLSVISPFPSLGDNRAGNAVAPRYRLNFFIKLHLFLFRLKGSHGTLVLWARQAPLNDAAVPDPSSLARESSSPHDMGITGPSGRCWWSTAFVDSFWYGLNSGYGCGRGEGTQGTFGSTYRPEQAFSGCVAESVFCMVSPITELDDRD